MSIEDTNWEALKLLSGSELRDSVFRLLQETALAIQLEESDDPWVLSVIPRLTELVELRQDLAGFADALSSLARASGLWNYIDRKHADPRDRLIAEAVTIRELGDFALHREQIAALGVLLSGKNLVLSAPTSFGKSVLVDVLLLSGHYSRIAIVLPTIALLDEFRRRLVARFGYRFDVIMHNSEKATRDHVVFLGTQERLINRDDLADLDLVVVDEFYKLDPQRRDARAVTLNAAVYRLLRAAKQFFFLGPNIQEVRVSEGVRWRFEFLRTRFMTVAVDTFDLRRTPDKEERLGVEVYNPDNWPALVFVSSPDRANDLGKRLVGANPSVGAGEDLAAWMQENYGPRWEVSAAVSAGIGIHHGRIPRALASRFVRLFNEGSLPILLCTSTLIEGVNTAAKSVLIYDKKIDRSNYDFFTFSNIRGRAGRLGQHYVGKVFLFHEPPEAEQVEVTAPLFGDLDDAPDELVVYIEPDDTTPEMSDRMRELMARLGLSQEQLRRIASIGIENLVELRQAVKNALRANHQLIWSQPRPTYHEILAVCSVICKVRAPRDFGAGSDKHVAYYLNQLRSYSRIRSFYHWHSDSFRGDSSRVDGVFKFLRACEHTLPEYFTAVEVFCENEGREVSYSAFVGEMSCWFRAPVLKELEEQGVPIQISERFHRRGDSTSTLGSRLRAMAQADDKRLTFVERNWILDALPG